MLSRKITTIVSGVVLFALGAAAGGTVTFLYGDKWKGAGDTSIPENEGQPVRIATALPPKAFGKWVLRCTLPKTGDKTCLLMLQVVAQDRKRLLLRLAVNKTNDGKSTLTVVTPPNASLTGGVSLTPDGAGQEKLAFALCGPGACRAPRELDAALVSAITASKTLKVGYTNAAGKPVSYALPVDGFAQGLAALKAS